MLYKVPLLPLSIDLETKPILKKLTEAHRALAELKGVTEIMPNQGILIDTLSLQEAKDSSAIENILTTHDDLYKSDSFTKQFVTPAAKEVYNYAAALRKGYEKVRKNNLLTNNDILQIQHSIVDNKAGFRKLSGTELKNEQTGQVVYSPPQDTKQIIRLMCNLEKYINDEQMSDVDPLIKMSIIHHQFESIHPFYDGNGRTGRIINILYLVKSGLLNTPVLYLSRFINQNKADYYRLLQSVRDTSIWGEWVLFILEAIIKTSLQTIYLVKGIKNLMLSHKNKIRQELPKIYSQDLLNSLFRHPYTKIDFIVQELQVTRKTASKYLNELVRVKAISKQKLGKDNYYINEALLNFLLNVNVQENS